MMDKTMKDFGAVMRGMAYAALESAFNAEWIALDSASARLVAQDFLEASEEENIGAGEYRRRIGAGNLRAYADCMVARERKGW